MKVFRGVEQSKEESTTSALLFKIRRKKKTNSWLKLCCCSLRLNLNKGVDWKGGYKAGYRVGEDGQPNKVSCQEYSFGKMCTQKQDVIFTIWLHEAAL